MDFTLKSYYYLLETLQSQGFSFQTYMDFARESQQSCFILRHDVDKLPQNSLRFAQIQHEGQIKGTYYFRVVPESWDEAIMEKIARMGHEIGYHYETMDSANAKCEMRNVKCGKEELVDIAYEEFCINLEKFRKIVPVTTICMHGSPRSKFDNRDIWKKNNYRDLGILAEPYFDLDFSKTFYLTDTGRCWDGDKYSVRDKPMKNLTSPTPTDLSRVTRDASPPPSRVTRHPSRPPSPFPSYHFTSDIIHAVNNGTFPRQTMMTFHPQRWHDNLYDWSKELVAQNVKNVIKRWFFVKP